MNAKRIRTALRRLCYAITDNRIGLIWPFLLPAFRRAYQHAFEQPNAFGSEDLVVLYADGHIDYENWYTMGGNDHAYSYGATAGIHAILVVDLFERRYSPYDDAEDEPQRIRWSAQIARTYILGCLQATWLSPLIRLQRAIDELRGTGLSKECPW